MMEKEYIRVPQIEDLPDSSEIKREMNDTFCINLIHHHLIRFYKEYNQYEFKEYINMENASSIRNNFEEYIKDYMKNWFDSDRKFGLHGLIINLESKVKYLQKGFYDIKFQHSSWRNPENQKSKYYPFECKNLSKSGVSIKEYVFNQAKGDGGLYRYFNGKYAQEQNFGGMLGFIIDGNATGIKNKIIEMIKITFIQPVEGVLSGNGIELNTIENNEFTFNSIHNRAGAVFTVHHILFEIPIS